MGSKNSIKEMQREFNRHTLVDVHPSYYCMRVEERKQPKVNLVSLRHNNIKTLSGQSYFEQSVIFHSVK
jgi:hypothetical protein